MMKSVLVFVDQDGFFLRDKKRIAPKDKPPKEEEFTRLP